MSSLKPDILPQSKEKTTNWPEPVFEQITIADGLPENSVFSMLQDRFGYLWFGTQNGLARYDGYNMKVFTWNPDDSLSISGGNITAIYEDKEGTLWTGTSYGALNRFNRKTETFDQYIIESDNQEVQTSITCIYEDNDGSLFTGTRDGLYLFDRNTETFKYINYEGLVYSNDVYEYIQSLVDRRKRISPILKVGDNADFTVPFVLERKLLSLQLLCVKPVDMKQDG